MPEPLLRWAGGKFRLAGPILAEAARLLSRPVMDPFAGLRLVEPFCGSLGFTLGAIPHGLVPSRLSDLNPALTNLHTQVRNNSLGLRRELLTRPWGRAPTSNEYYWERDRFNTVLAKARLGTLPPGDSVGFAASTLWLNRHCFNGLYRENASGEFNVPIGRLANWPDPPGLAELVALKNALRTATITCQTFEACLISCGPGDFVYADPPYRATHGSYTGAGFSDFQRRNLVAGLRYAAERGAVCVASDSDDPTVAAWYLDNGFRVGRVSEPRSISRDGGGRKPVACLVAARVG